MIWSPRDVGLVVEAMARAVRAEKKDHQPVRDSTRQAILSTTLDCLSREDEFLSRVLEQLRE